MPLPRRQALAVNRIIQEELQNVMKGRQSRNELLRRGYIQERLLSEDSPDAMRIDSSIMKDQLNEVVQGLGMRMADDLVFKFRQKVVPAMAYALNQHSMSDSHVNPRTFDDELVEFDQDGVMDASRECMSDILTALEKYAFNLGELAVHMVGGTPADEDFEK